MKKATHVAIPKFVKPEKNDGESKADYDARVEAAEAAYDKAQVDADAKAKYDSEAHNVIPETVIRERPTRVIVEYADGHVIESTGDNIKEYQGLSPATSEEWVGYIQLRLKVPTSNYMRREMGDLDL